MKRLIDEDYENALSSLLKQQSTDTNKFLSEISVFNKTDEEVVAIYKALKDPEMNKLILESFGMTEDVFKA